MAPNIARLSGLPSVQASNPLALGINGEQDAPQRSQIFYPHKTLNRARTCLAHECNAVDNTHRAYYRTACRGISSRSKSGRCRQSDSDFGFPPRAGYDRPEITALSPELKTNKTELVISLLSTPSGATIDDVMNATTWQKHSVRGFLSGTVRKKLGLNLISEVAGDGIRRYRIEDRDGVDKDHAGAGPTSVSTQGGHHPTPISQAE